MFATVQARFRQRSVLCHRDGVESKLPVVLVLRLALPRRFMNGVAVDRGASDVTPGVELTLPAGRPSPPYISPR